MWTMKLNCFDMDKTPNRTIQPSRKFERFSMVTKKYIFSTHFANLQMEGFLPKL